MTFAPTFGSVFAGIGGFDLGLERAGWRCLWQVEIDPFCSRVLARRWPQVLRHGDVRSLVLCPDDSRCLEACAPGCVLLERVDLLCGGFPCQGLSVAGRRRGLRGDPRSALFFEFARLAAELRPRWLLVENVPGLLSSHKGQDLAVLLHALEDLGYAWAYRTLDSRWFGVPQRRRRVFVLACGCAGGACGCAAEVLLEPEGGAGHPPPGGEAGAGAARALTGRSGGSGGAERDGGDTLVAQAIAGRDWRGVKDGDPLVFATLNSAGNDGGFRTEPGEHFVAFNLRGREEGARVETAQEASLRSSPGGSSRSYVALGDHGADQEQADGAGGGAGAGAEGPGAPLPAVGPPPAGNAGFRAARGEADPDGQLLLLAFLPPPRHSAEDPSDLVAGEAHREPAAGSPGGGGAQGEGLARPDMVDARGDGFVPETAATLNPGHEAKQTYAGDGGTMNLVAPALRTNPYNNSDPGMEARMLVTHALSADGHDASEDGTGRGTPLVIQDPRDIDKAQHGLGMSGEGVCYTVDAKRHRPSRSQRGRGGVGRTSRPRKVSPTR